MAVPGNVLSGRNRGGHALIRDGATIVECADDIVQELALAPALRGARTLRTQVVASQQLPPIRVLRRMEAGMAYDLDALAGLSGLDTARLLPRLLDLELQGRIRRIGGGRFIRADVNVLVLSG